MAIADRLRLIVRPQVDLLLNWKDQHIDDQEARQGENKILNKVTWILTMFPEEERLEINV